MERPHLGALLFFFVVVAEQVQDAMHQEHAGLLLRVIGVVGRRYRRGDDHIAKHAAAFFASIIFVQGEGEYVSGTFFIHIADVKARDLLGGHEGEREFAMTEALSHQGADRQRGETVEVKRAALAVGDQDAG